MSIIFQTLSKLQSASSEASPVPADDDRPPGQESIPSGRRRPLVITGIAAAASILLGFALIYGARFVVTHAVKAGGEVAVSPNTTAKGDFFPVEEPNQETLAVRDTITVRNSSPRYLPPEETPTTDTPMVAATDNTPVVDTRINDTPIVAYNAPERKDNEPRSGDAAPSPAVPATSKTADAGISSMSPSRDTAPAPEPPVAVKAPISVEQRKVEKARQAALERNERIRRLVSRIEAALSSNSMDNQHIEASLDELAQLKQSGSPYVDKLRAYWLLKTGAYDEAEALLEKLAAVDEDDLEVGINLAVIDIRRGEVEAALFRLQRLKKAHPDNARLIELIRKLR